MVITNPKNDRIKEIKKLNQKKYRDISNLFLVEGEHLVLEAYKKGKIKELILEQNESLSIDVPTLYVSSDVINNISELETPQKVLAVCYKLDEEEIGNRILILDGVQDPGNLGTIIRSAVAFNIDTIVLSNDTVDLYNSKVVRATQGLMFHINIIKRDLKTFIPSLKEYKVLSTNVNGGKSIKTIDKLEKFAIIMGNEGNGVKEEINKMCDDFIYIDMNKKCESLNVAVATSIILYELDK